VKEMMLLTPEFSPTVNVNVSVFISSDELDETVVGTDVESVVEAPPHADNANTATAARANFFIDSFFQRCAIRTVAAAVTMNRNRIPGLLL